MNTLQGNIKNILAKEHYTFKQLADYLNLTEEELENGLSQKTLELRYLEEISKNLKVPLYSFFRDPDVSPHATEKRHYVNKLWDDKEDSSSQKLMEEILQLKHLLSIKEAELSEKLKDNL